MSTAVGAFNTTRINHTLVCLPDPFKDESGEGSYFIWPQEIMTGPPSETGLNHGSCAWTMPLHSVQEDLRFCFACRRAGSISLLALCVALFTLAAAAAIAHISGFIRLTPQRAGPDIAAHPSWEGQSLHGSPLHTHSSGKGLMTTCSSCISGKRAWWSHYHLCSKQKSRAVEPSLICVK